MSDFNFRRLVIALLGLNTFLLCGLAGAGFFYLRHEAVPMIARLPLAGEQLTKDDRDALQLALNNARKAVRQQSLEARQARIEAAALMGEPTLDGVALAAALDRARDAEYAVRKATEAAAVDFARALPLDARRRLAEGLLGREAPRPATK
ncbi:MAG: periplasmic heavy metal sensor [Rhizobium sp.]